MIYYIDDILVYNKEIFNDTEGHFLTMEFHDGYAISKDNKYALTYPTLEQVKKTRWMQEEILNCVKCDGCDGTRDPFNVALKYGVLFQLPQDNKAECKVKWLEQFAITCDDRKEAYEKFCKELDAPNKEYFVVFHDRTGDEGMKVSYLGECDCDRNAVKAAFSTCIIPQGAVHYYRAEDIEEAHNAIDYGEGMEVIDVYHSPIKELDAYWTIVSAPASENKFAAFIWNRGDRSQHVSNRFYTFSFYSEMQTFVLSNKVLEMKDDLPEFGISWFLDTLNVDTGLIPDTALHNIHIWANEGYDVWIACGTYK